MALRLTRSKYLFSLLFKSPALKLNYSSFVQKSVLNAQKPSIPSLVTLTKRLYATAGNEKQAEIEEKVLNIFTNFDRIKENPAKPIV